MKSKISITLNEKTIDAIDSIVDFIYIRNRSQAIEHLINKAMGENKNAVILFGGEENSLKVSADEYRITAKINSLTVVEHAIKKLRKNSFRSIYVVARQPILTKIFNLVRDGSSYGVKIEYVQETVSRGSAASLRLIKGHIKGNFLVVFGDIVFDKINIEELWNDHLKHGGISTLMLTTSPTPSKKGIVKMEGSKVLEFMQKPKDSDIFIGFSSIFAAEPEILEYKGNSLEKDVFPELAKKGLLNGHLSSEKEIHIHTAEDIKKMKKK